MLAIKALQAAVGNGDETIPHCPDRCRSRLGIAATASLRFQIGEIGKIARVTPAQELNHGHEFRPHRARCRKASHNLPQVRSTAVIVLKSRAIPFRCVRSRIMNESIKLPSIIFCVTDLDGTMVAVTSFTSWQNKP
jgi:hypothetical protein